MKFQKQWIAKAIEQRIGPEEIERIPERKILPVMLNLIGCTDATASSQELLSTYAPDIKILGYQLKKEREEEYQGVMMRALENEEGDERCLQYLYVYQRQRGVVSLLWMSIIRMISCQTIS